MKTQDFRNRKRVLARRLARELTSEELGQVGGHGTSYGGTGSCINGKADDIEGRDCVDGQDTFEC